MSTQTLAKEPQTNSKALNRPKKPVTATHEPQSKIDAKTITVTPMTQKSMLEHWLSLPRNQLDEIYKQAQPGALPQGDTRGTAILAGGPLPKLFAKLANIVAWQGKVFDLFSPGFNSGVVVNKVSPFGLNLIVAKIYRGESWMDGKDTIIIDYSGTSLFARQIRDEIREVKPGLYLGKVWWGKTRILDFALETHQVI